MPFDFGNLFGGLITGFSNLFATDATNLAQIKIAQETNAMNYKIASERNQMQIRESEKAYDRSTAANQIKELVRTGISQQQARQIVAGSGSPATYTPSQIEGAQMQAPTIQAPDLSGFGSAAGSIGGLIDNAIADPNGGALGFTSAHNAMQDLNDIITVLPESSLISWRDFNSFVDSSDNELVKKFRDSDSYKRIKRNLFGQKAFMNYARNSYDVSGADALRKSAIFDSQMKEIELSITKFREKIEQSNMNVLLTENNLRLQNLPDLYARDLLLIQDELATLKPQYKYHSSEEYQQQALEIFKLHNLNEKWFEHFKYLKNDAAQRGYANMSAEEQLLLDFISNMNVMGIDNEKVLALMLAAQVTSGIKQDVAEAPKHTQTIVDKIERASQINDQKRKDALGIRRRGAQRSF